MAMKLTFVAPNQVAYEELSLGDPGPGEVLARTVISGISHGTEMTAFRGTSPFLEKTMTPERVFTSKGPDDPAFYPFRYAGYDAVGIVERVGEGVTKYQPGDRVWHQIQHQTGFLFPEEHPQVFRLSAAVPDDEAILTNLISIALCAVHDAEVKLGDVVAVFGGGIVGQMAAQLALLSGARRVFLSEPSAERRAFAVAHAAVEAMDPGDGLAARTIIRANGGMPPDVVIECSGVVAGLHEAIKTAGVAGTVIAAGFYAGDARALFLGEELLHNRVTIKASMSKWGCPARFRNWDETRLLSTVNALLEQRRLKLDGVVSARFPFLEAQQAYEAIRDAPQRYLKAALVY